MSTFDFFSTSFVRYVFEKEEIENDKNRNRRQKNFLATKILCKEYTLQFFIKKLLLINTL